LSVITALTATPSDAKCATDGRTVVAGPGIDDLVVVGEAERAAHSITVTLSHREGVGVPGSVTPEGGEPRPG